MFHLGDVKRVDDTASSGIKLNSFKAQWKKSQENRGDGENQTFNHHGERAMEKKGYSQRQQKT